MQECFSDQRHNILCLRSHNGAVHAGSKGMLCEFINDQRTRAPSRRTVAVSDSESFRASRAASAFDSCHTPTMALRIKISRITAGSMNARMPSSLLPSSNSAKKKDMTAANSRTCIAPGGSEHAAGHGAPSFENVPVMQ
jgi:hypothetical protein